MTTPHAQTCLGHLGPAAIHGGRREGVFRPFRPTPFAVPTNKVCKINAVPTVPTVPTGTMSPPGERKGCERSELEHSLVAREGIVSVSVVYWSGGEEDFPF